MLLDPGSANNSDCWCLWGTINYSFCAYSKNLPQDSSTPMISANSSDVGKGRCPVVTGESLLCSDLTSLGNCYNGAYSCTVDSAGLCHCMTV